MLNVETFNACTEYLDERPVRRCTSTLLASAPDHAHPSCRRVVRNLLGETSLTDARLTTKQKHSAATSADVVQPGAKFRQIALSADERIVRRLAIQCPLRSHFGGP